MAVVTEMAMDKAMVVTGMETVRAMATEMAAVTGMEMAKAMATVEAMAVVTDSTH